MNKRNILFLVILSFLLIPNAFALNCVKSQIVGQSDACWTQVTVAAGETGVVSAGSVLVYEFTNSDDADMAAVTVRRATASNQSHRVAGVAQSVIATGDTGVVLVRGKGKLCVKDATSSGDPLYVSSSAGLAGRHNSTSIGSGDPIAFALQANTTENPGASIDAYITIL